MTSASRGGKKSMAKASEPILERASYAPSRDVVSLHLSTGALVEIPRAAIEELRNLDVSELRTLKADNAGMTLSQRDLDIDIFLPGLLAEAFALNVSAMLGKKGGAKTSAAKQRASKENGRRGGRPKKHVLA